MVPFPAFSSFNGVGYRVFIKYCVFFPKNIKYSGLLPFSIFPRWYCVYTYKAGRTALQQNWQSSEKSQNFKEKITIFNGHPVTFSQYEKFMLPGTFQASCQWQGISCTDTRCRPCCSSRQVNHKFFFGITSLCPYFNIFNPPHAKKTFVCLFLETPYLHVEGVQEKL